MSPQNRLYSGNPSVPQNVCSISGYHSEETLDIPYCVHSLLPHYRPGLGKAGSQGRLNRHLVGPQPHRTCCSFYDS